MSKKRFDYRQAYENPIYQVEEKGVEEEVIDSATVKEEREPIYDPGEETEAKKSTSATRIVIPSALNIRLKPSAGADVLRVASKGDKIEIDSSYVNDSWVKLVDGGYAMSEFLSD